MLLFLCLYIYSYINLLIAVTWYMNFYQFYDLISNTYKMVFKFFTKFTCSELNLGPDAWRPSHREGGSTIVLSKHTLYGNLLCFDELT